MNYEQALRDYELKNKRDEFMGIPGDKSAKIVQYTGEHMQAFYRRICQLEADLRGQVAAKHQLGMIASQFKSDLLEATQ